MHRITQRAAVAIATMLLLAGCNPFQRDSESEGRNDGTQVSAQDPHNPCQQLTKGDIKDVLGEELNEFGLDADGEQTYSGPNGQKHWICIHATSTHTVTKQVQIATQQFPTEQLATEEFTSEFEQWEGRSEYLPAPTRHNNIGDAAFTRLDDDLGVIYFASGPYVVEIVVQKITVPDMERALQELGKRAAGRVSKL